MMLVNACVIIFIISFINSLFCIAEQLKEETTTVTTALDDVTMESPKVTDKEQLNKEIATVKIATHNINYDDGEGVQKTITEQLKEEIIANTIAPDLETIELPDETDKEQLNKMFLMSKRGKTSSAKVRQQTDTVNNAPDTRNIKIKLSHKTDEGKLNQGNNIVNITSLQSNSTETAEETINGSLNKIFWLAIGIMILLLIIIIVLIVICTKGVNSTTFLRVFQL